MNNILINLTVPFAKTSLRINTDTNYCKVREYSHFTNKYRGAAHSICNLKYSIPNKIPMVFHNGSNYNYHLIIKNERT